MLIQSPGSAKDSFRGFSKEELNTTNEKMEQQQQHLLHIKRLLSTAAAGAGIVGDLDAAQQQQSTTAATGTGTIPATQTSQTSTTPPGPARKGERNLWRLEEIKEMLTIMQETNALDLLNDKMIKSESVFYDIQKLMHRRGYNKKTHNQIWTKWKFLKSTYMTSRRNAIIPKMIPGEIYLLLHKMLGNGSDLIYTPDDSSNACSLDDGGGGGGGSGILLNSNADEDIEESLLLKTNAKSNGAAGVGTKNNTGKETTEKPTSAGMAHPIFGFRLGMVKTEPADTGYETTANNSVISENDSLENSTIYAPQDSQNKVMPILEIKPEPNERVTDSPASIEPIRGSTLLERSSTPENELDNDNNSLLVPRETTPASAMSSSSIRPLAVKQKVTPTRVAPPLRIATFAKETAAASDLPPPPLRPLNNANASTTSTVRQTTELAASSSGSVFSVSPAITIPTSPSRGSILRLPRDVTLQLRTNYNPYNDNSSYQIASMQKLQTNYALRGEGGYVINRPRQHEQQQQLPQINQKQTSTSTSSQHHQQQHQHEQPMTSQMAKLRASILNKKRRLEIPNWQENATQMPAKKQQKKFDCSFNSNLNSSSASSGIRNNSYYGNKARTEPEKRFDNDGDGDDDDDDDDDDGDEDDDYDDDDQDMFMDNKSKKMYKPVSSFQNNRNYEQPLYSKNSHTKTAANQPTMSQTTSSFTSKPKKNRTPAEEILKDMAMSLRQSQLQMVNDFFEQQMEFARKEHEFQMEQDRLMMSAFKKQTQQLMKAAQQLFGESASGSGSGNSFMKTKKNKSSEKRLTKLQNTFLNKTNKKQAHHKIANTPRHSVPSSTREAISKQDFLELSSSDSVDNDDDNTNNNAADDDNDDNDEHEATEEQETVDTDPLMATFDPTQFLSSELVESNDDDDDDDDDSDGEEET